MTRPVAIRHHGTSVTDRTSVTWESIRGEITPEFAIS